LIAFDQESSIFWNWLTSGLWVVVTPASLEAEGDPECGPRADETGAGVWANATEQERRSAEKQTVKRNMG
jgi:hypothetical protein